MSSKKNVLFYSPNCKFCTELLTTLMKHNCVNGFLCVNVESGKFSLPPFVDRVPLIYTTNGQVLTESTLDTYVSALCDQVTHDVTPFSILDLGGSRYAEDFSYITEENDALSTTANTVSDVPSERKFTLINESTNNDSMNFALSLTGQKGAANGVDTRSGGNGGGGGGGYNNNATTHNSRFDSSAYDRLLKDREMDLSRHLPPKVCT